MDNLWHVSRHYWANKNVTNLRIRTVHWYFSLMSAMCMLFQEKRMSIVTDSSKLCQEHSSKATFYETVIATEVLMSSSWVSISITAYHCSRGATLSAMNHKLNDISLCSQKGDYYKVLCQAQWLKHPNWAVTHAKATSPCELHEPAAGTWWTELSVSGLQTLCGQCHTQGLRFSVIPIVQKRWKAMGV